MSGWTNGSGGHGSRRRYLAEQQVQMEEIAKREPLTTTMSQSQARKIVAQHGSVGPLPKTLGRPERMAAYEARYVANGGPAGEKWSRRASHSDKIKTAALGGATGAAAGLLASRTKPGGRALAALRRNTPMRNVSDQMFNRRVENTALGAAAVGGGAELYGDVARHKQSSYHSAPAGVAASSLRRMRDYTPAPGGSQ